MAGLPAPRPREFFWPRAAITCAACSGLARQNADTRSRRPTALAEQFRPAPVLRPPISVAMRRRSPPAPPFGPLVPGQRPFDRPPPLAASPAMRQLLTLVNIFSPSAVQRLVGPALRPLLPIAASVAAANTAPVAELSLA